tara:strand:- start:507 stop:698 length:192 start_codon:yes stop_codon:yes gene_type:complete
MSSTEHRVIRSEECNVFAGLYKNIIDERCKLLKKVSQKYKIPYDELLLKYCPEAIAFGVSKTF